MILRIILFGFMATGLLGFGLILWITSRGPTNPAAAKITTIAVLAAAHELHPGSLIKPEDLIAKPLKQADLPADASPDTPDARRGLTGAMVRRALGPQDIIRPQDVMRPGEHGFLAAVLAPGMRAVTVGVDVISGTAGLIWPGDRVDVILTQSMDQHGAPPGRQVAAEAVLSDARVIAIDQRLVEGAAPGDAAGKEARTVTLEVTAEAAERLAVATRLGRLSLAVRSTERSPGPPAPPAATVWAADVSPALADQPTHDSPGVVRVFQGAADGKEFRF